MSVSQGYKYLLVMTDTFTGWVEGFPTKTEEVLKKNKTKQKQTNKKKLLHEIILRFGLHRSLQSDNGTPFFLRSPKGSLKHWALLITSIVPGGLSL